MDDEVWSIPTTDGLSNWWRFDENQGAYAFDQIQGKQGTLVGVSSADRVFGYDGKSIRFVGDGGHVVVKGFKGIVGSLPRTLSVWVKTTDADASLLSWGGSGDGNLWEMGLEGGALKLSLGGGELLGSRLVDNGEWRHLSVSLPPGSSVLSDCSLYVDGDQEIQSLNGADVLVETSNDQDLMMGTNVSGDHFNGLIDEVRLYERGLSSIEIKSIALDGTIRFTTSAVPQPPSVEIVEITP